MTDTELNMYSVTLELPAHLRDWQLPPGWSWGADGLSTHHRHYQEIHDALGRSLSLVSAPDPSHHAWLEAEARHLAHRNHPAMPTTYHYWATFGESRRGPGYLRRWIAGETLGARLRRMGSDDVPGVMRVLREIGSALTYLHDLGATHGALSPDNVWTTPMGRLWIIGWQWAMPSTEIPPGLAPDFRLMALPSEWSDGKWRPSPATDQWQLAAICFAMLTGEMPPSNEVPPLQLLRPDATLSVRTVLDRALSPDPDRRYPSIAAMLRAVDRVVGSRTMVMLSRDEPNTTLVNESAEVRLRWALADDYEVLAALGS